MKNNVTKRVFAVVVALVLAVVMVLPAFAVDTPDTNPYSITINVNGNYTKLDQPGRFVAYQIFSGRVVVDGGDNTTSGDNSERQLANIVWGSAITDNGAALLLALADSTLASKFDGKTTAADVASVLEGLTETELQEFARILTEEITLASGKSSHLTDGAAPFVIDELAAGYYVVRDEYTGIQDEHDSISFNILKVLQNRSATVKADVPKVEKEIVDPSTGNANGDDYNIGDTVTFQLTGTLYAYVTKFASYTYKFVDTLSSGLTYDAISSVKLYTSDEDTTGTTLNTGVSESGVYYTVNHDDGTLTVEVKNLNNLTTLTDTAKVVVVYTAKLNSNAALAGEGNENAVKIVFSNNPYFEADPSNPDDDGTGETPEEKVYVYTFGVDFTKVGDDDAHKEGGIVNAGFKIQRADNKWAVIDNDGKVTGWADTENGGTEILSDSQGKFHVYGLDVGTYTLRETQTPNGYNTMADATFTIEASYDEDGVLEEATLTSTGTITVTSDTLTSTGDDDTFAAKVLNTRATTLPGTGGMGTTIFYTVGAVMLAVAVVFLCVSKVQKKSRD